MKISVIMSAYNSEEFIEETIESVLSQSFGNFELLITNDCSDDNTLKIIRKYKDSRIVLINNDLRFGLTKNLNNMLNKAKGEYIARIDADDICLPHRFEIQVDFLDKNSNIGIVGSSAISIGNSSGMIKSIEGNENIKCSLLFGNCMIHPSIMIRKKMLDDFNLCYDENYLKAQDYELWSRAIRYMEFDNIGKPLIKYRYHKKQISNCGVVSQTRYADNVRISQLNYLGIEINEREQKIYNKIIMDKDSIKIEEIEVISDIFLKIIEANMRKKYYQQHLLRKCIKNFFANIYIYSDKNIACRCKSSEIWKQTSLGMKMFYTIIRHKRLINSTNNKW